MKNYISQFEDLLRRFIRRHAGIILLVIGAVLGYFIRFPFLANISRDYHFHIKPWYDFIAAHGAWGSFAHDFSNYPPLYLHLLSAVVFLPGEAIIKIKLLSIVFDYLAAFTVYRLLKKDFPSGLKPAAGFWAVLFLPTVILNSAMWGQCDMIHTWLIILSVFLLLTEKKGGALMSYGLALALKPHAMFLAPLFAALWLRGRLSLKHFLIMAGVFVLTFVPSWIAGRPLSELIGIFSAQPEKHLTWNAHSIWAWFPRGEQHFDILNQAGMWVSAAVMFSLTFGLSRIRLNTSLHLIRAALFCALFLPFIFPQMHERYFFLADVLSIIYAVYRPKHFWMPAVIVSASFLSYIPFLFGKTMPIVILPFFLLPPLLVLARDLLSDV